MVLLRNFINRHCLKNHSKCFSNTKDPKEVEYKGFLPKRKPVLEKWNEPEGVWRSTVEFFEPKRRQRADTIRVLQTPIDLRPKTIEKWYERRMLEKEINSQKFLIERFNLCGPDLTAAHFILNRGGAVRFLHEKNWVRNNPKTNTNTLPDKYVPGLFVEAINAENTELRYEGLENFSKLRNLHWLSLANNPFINDWCLDKISSCFQTGLQYLDLSNCPGVSHRALHCFYRMLDLDTLVIENREDPEFKLTCMMLEDMKPTLTIKGLTHNTIID